MRVPSLEFFGFTVIDQQMQNPKKDVGQSDDHATLTL